MTIHGDGSSLITYEVPEDAKVFAESIYEELGSVTDDLFNRLLSAEVDFDTTTGNITFPYSKGYRDLTGKTTWTRIFQDWVFIRLREMDVSDELREVQTLVINGLHQQAGQYLGIELL